VEDSKLNEIMAGTVCLFPIQYACSVNVIPYAVELCFIDKFVFRFKRGNRRFTIRERG
jgi:hypothetical protein